VSAVATSVFNPALLSVQIYSGPSGKSHQASQHICVAWPAQQRRYRNTRESAAIGGGGWRAGK